MAATGMGAIARHKKVPQIRRFHVKHYLLLEEADAKTMSLGFLLRLHHTDMANLNVQKNKMFMVETKDMTCSYRAIPMIL